jgi:regulator of sigma E protease
MVTLVAFIVLLGVLITVHEFGHFLVAKAAGVKVQVFSIGFGKALFSRKIGETEYRISMLPVGGYVQMLGMNPEDVHDDGPDAGRDLMSKAPLTRILIFLAGPGMNLILPFILLVPFIATSDRAKEVIGTTVGAVDAGLPAYAAGLRAGDRIIEIDGEPLYAFWQVAQHIHDFDGDVGAMELKVQRHSVEAPVTLTVVPKLIERTDRRVNFSKKSYHIGFQPLFLSPDIAVTGPDTPAARAGLKTFDRVLAINDTDTPRLLDVQRLLAEVPEGQSVKVRVERDTGIDAQFPFFVREEPLELTYHGSATAPGLEHAGPCISSLAPGTPAGDALQVGDCILAVDGFAHSLGTFIENRLGNAPDQPKALRVRRNGQRIAINIEPRKVVHTDPLAGEIVQWQRGFVLLTRPDTLTAPDQVPNDHRLAHAWRATVDHVSHELQITINMVAGLFTGRVSASQLSGPITIAAVAGQYARAGLDHFIQLMIMLSLSIALLNLLPVPGLDGGQIMVATIELVVRRPLPRKTQQTLQVIGAAMIVLLILFVTGNDLLRQWRLHAG